MIGPRSRWLSSLLALALIASLVLTTAPASAGAPSGERLPSLQSVLRPIKSQIIVRFQSEVSSAQAAAAIGATGGTVKKSVQFHNTRLAAYATASEAAAALKTLNASPNVVYAFYNQRLTVPKDQSKPAIPGRLRGRSAPLPRTKEPAPTAPTAAGSQAATGAHQPFAAADDALRSNQWYLDRIGYNLAGSPPDEAPVVAVIDSGVDYRHPDLAGNVIACPTVPGMYCDLVGYDQDPIDELFHGTHVAGTIAAKADGMGITGVSPTSKILPVRILNEWGYTDTMTLLQGIDYTMQAKVQIPSLRVANLSLGGYFLAGSYAHQEINAWMRALRNTGILPVVAAGNDSDFWLQAIPLVYGEEIVELPAMSPASFAVAATDQNDYRTFFSNYSTHIKINNCEKKYEWGDCAARNTYRTKTYPFAPVAAPGWMVLAPAPEGQYWMLAGTSMATPQVAGAAARVMAKYPGLTNYQVQLQITDTGLPLAGSKGFPITTRRLDLRRALGIGGTGFTGRVMDGINGRPLSGATVVVSSGTTSRTATTNDQGFYTVSELSGGTQYTIEASKSDRSYITNSRTATTVGGRYVDPGDVSLAMARTDGAYTFMLEWKNVLSGIDEYYRAVYWCDYEARGCPRYPWPVNPYNQPFAMMDSVFGVPYPSELTDSVEFTWWNPGSLSSFPYGKFMHDSEFDLSPHEGIILRQLPPIGAVRYGVKWFSPAGVSNPGAKLTVYRNRTLLRQAELVSAAAPTDGTPGNGRYEGWSTWGLYNISPDGWITAQAGDPDGKRSDYETWISRNNNIQGKVGPGAGKSVTAELDMNFNWDGPFVFDLADVYSFELKEGQTYTFKLTGPRRADFDLLLYGRRAKSIYYDWEIKGTWGSGSNESLTYKVPAGRSGKYYLAVMGWYGSGEYKLSR